MASHVVLSCKALVGGLVGAHETGVRCGLLWQCLFLFSISPSNHYRRFHRTQHPFESTDQSQTIVFVNRTTSIRISTPTFWSNISHHQATIQPKISSSSLTLEVHSSKSSYLKPSKSASSKSNICHAHGTYLIHTSTTPTYEIPATSC